MNLVAGIGDAFGGVLADSGAPLVLHGDGAPAAAGMPASAVFSPGAVHVVPAMEQEPATSAPNRWRGTVATLRPVPGGVRIGIAEHPALAVDVPSAAAVSLDLTTGARLEFSIPAADVSVRNHS